MVKNFSGMSAKARRAEGDGGDEPFLLNTSWTAWAKSLEASFIGVLSVCHLFRQHDAEPTLAALKAAVQGMTQQPLDGTTLRVLGAVHGDVVRLEGGGDGDDTTLTVRIDFDQMTPAKKVCSNRAHAPQCHQTLSSPASHTR